MNQLQNYINELNELLYGLKDSDIIMAIPCSYIIFPTCLFDTEYMELLNNKLPSVSSIILPETDVKEKLPGLTYSPNKFDGIEIAPISEFDSVGNVLLMFMVLLK